VFHYPPNPLSENGLRPAPKERRSRAKNGQGYRSNESSSSEESGSSSDDDEEEHQRQLQSQSQNQNQSHLSGSVVSGRRSSNFGLDDHVAVSGSPGGDSQRAGSLGSGRTSFRKRGANSDVEEDSGAASDRQEDGSGGPYRPPWESLLGLPADVWEKLLSPSPAWHKRRFEVGINDLALVGWPVFVREDGTWRKQRRKKKKKRRAAWEGGELGHNEDAEDAPDDEDGDAGGNASGDGLLAASTETLSPKQTTFSETKRASGASSKAARLSVDCVDGDDKDSMTMFNVVFVLDPPLLEYSMRTREVYDNIIKKFAKALKWEQARTDYVWREAQHISHLKEKAKERSKSMLDSIRRDV
jgi:hypothetical protein